MALLFLSRFWALVIGPWAFRRGPASARLLVFTPDWRENDAVKLDLRQKQTLYHELGQFLRSGIPLPQAVEALAQDTRSGPLQQVLHRLSHLFTGGETVPGAFARLQPTVGSMEIALVEAANVSGRLEQAFTYLSNYFGSLDTLRSGLIRQAAWPLIQLHIGIFLLNGVDQFVRTHGFDPAAYALEVGSALGVLYLGAFGLWLGGAFLLKAGRTNTGIDRWINRLPLLGKLRRNMALSRFCASYEMQLQAGINVMDALRVSASASQSARIHVATEAMIPLVRGGSGLGPLLGSHSVFPTALQRAVRVGEETGSLDEDLRRWADYYHQAAVSSLEAISAWMPRIGFVVIAMYLGYKIISVYSGVVQGYEGILNFN